MRYSIKRAAGLPLALAALAACSSPEPTLRVGDVAFTDERIAGMTADERVLLADLAGLGQLTATSAEDSLVAPLASREAHLGRLRSLPYVLAARATGIGEGSLRALYADEPEWELSVRHVVRLVEPGASEAERAAALERAREAERRARAGEDFAAVAAELSEEPGAAARGGLLEPGRRGSWVDPFWEAALALSPGEISPVVETEYGYHVLRLDGREPVPFDEAARGPVLRRVIPARAAMEAMETWAAARPPVAVDPPAVLAAREALQRGHAPDTLLLALSPAGDVYDARDLALAWAALDAPERRAFAEAEDAEFGRWVADEVRQRFWADEAARLGADLEPGALERAEREWRGRLGRLAEGAGFAQGMAAERIAAAALAALSARGQEALIARAELPGLRPLLRAMYPVIEREQ